MKRISKHFGSIRKGRSKKCFLESSKIVEKEDRDFFDYPSDNYLFIVQWKGLKIVYIGLNFNNIDSTKMVKIYGRRK